MGQMMRRERERGSFLLDMPASPHASLAAKAPLMQPAVDLPHGWPRPTRATPFGCAAERVVDLAAAAFGTPAALACFAGPPAGLWIVQHGLDQAVTASWADWHVLARRNGACVVEDAWREPWLAQHPLVTGPAAARFYAAVPLRDRGGRQHGVLAILAPEPRPAGLAPQERARLQTLADMLMTEREAELRPDETQRRIAEAESTLRRREQQLRNQAHAIQEMDHRIRNGLQMVSDTLCLQALAGLEEGVAGRLNAAAGRIQAVAEVHAVLQRQPGVGLISARTCLEELLRPFGRLWQGSGRHARLREGGDVLISALDAPRLGLVAWELLANAMRHGQGDAVLEMRADGAPHRLRIAVQDDGPGSERLLRAASGAGCESGFGLIRLIAGGEAAEVRCGRPTEVSIVLDLPPAG